VRPLPLLLLICALLLTIRVEAGRPLALSGARLEAAKRDWGQVRAGRLTVDGFKGRHSITNGVMTRLRRAYPADFGRLDRSRSFSASELGRMQRDWKRVGAGQITLTEFKGKFGLSGETYKRLLSDHGDRFPQLQIKLGGSRLADQRRAVRLDAGRARQLADAWQAEVLSGQATVRQFYSKHGTSKREITELRKQPGNESLFGSATGMHARRQSSDVGRLSQIWNASVVPGRMSITEFRQAQGLSQGAYRELRKDHTDAFPAPQRTKRSGGGPERRAFTEAQLQQIKADWSRVLSQQMPRDSFMRKHGLHSKMLKRLRDENPGAFPSASGATRRTRFQHSELEVLRAEWLLVVAGRKSEADFRADHGLSTSLFKRLRSQPGHAVDFPKLKHSGKGAAKTVGAEAARDWLQVRGGQLATSAFRRRHPDVRAADLLSLQRGRQGATLRSLAASLEERALIEPDRLARLKAEWPRVMRGQVTQKSLLQQVGVPEHRLRQYRKQHPNELPRSTKAARRGSRYDVASTYSAAQLDAARALYARYQRGEIQMKRDVIPALHELGITATGQGLAYLRKLDPLAFGSRNAFVARNHDAIIGDLCRIAQTHAPVIRKWPDFLEVVGQDKAFAAKYGRQSFSESSIIIRRDRDGSRRLHTLLQHLGTQVGKDSGPHGSVAAGAGAALRPSAVTVQPRRDSARSLAQALKGLKPTLENLKRVTASMAHNDPNFSTRRKWLSLRAEYEGVFPELARWNFDAHRPYSVRYMARWTEAAHKAGPGASYEQIAAIFKRSPEYREDGRLPPKRSGTAQMAQHFPELVTSWASRRTYQRTRQLLELLRTAPAGQTLYKLKGELKKIGLPYSYAHKWLAQLGPAEAERCGMSRSTFNQLRAGGFHGLGERRDPRFDPHAEPSGVNMELVRDILDTPRTPPMLEYAIGRLDGRLPFESHNVMFVNHRYSDIVSLVDTMSRAGMEAKNAVFVSTPYPFKDAVSYQLKQRGVHTIVPKLDMDSYAQSVEQGIRRMLATHERQQRRWGAGKPILILDDGGMASKIIGQKFKQHIGKFRIVEVTAAGHRLAREFKQQYGRLPFVYYSIAYTKLKQKVTSSFFGRRVADRLVNLMPQTGVRPANREVAILGGGPMGLYAGIQLRQQGYHVTFVDPDPKVVRKLRWLKFDVAPVEQALPGRSIILGMSGYQTLNARHLKLIDDGAVVAQGSSKRKEFDMSAFERLALSRRKLPRQDGLAQQSFTYTFRDGRGRKQLHFLGDGWTLNHDGSLHGTPMRDIQLELALYFESAVQAASTPLGKTGVFREVSRDTQQEFLRQWKRTVGQK